MNFTYNNHLSYTVGDRVNGYRLYAHEPYQVNVGRIDADHYRTSSYQQELLRTADMVYQQLGSDMSLFLSGGTDSEIVLRNFLSIGVKPHCYTIKFKDDYNIADVNTSIMLAREFDVPLTVIDFDVKEYYNSGQASELAAQVQCSQIAYLVVYEAIKNLCLPSVMGGELLLNKNCLEDKSTWHYTFAENEDASAMRFSNSTGIPVVNEWFSYTPELMLYYLENPGIQSLVKTPNNYKWSSTSSKNRILTELVPGIRLRDKTHGYERLLGFNIEASASLSHCFVQRAESSADGIEFDTVIRQLKGQLASY